MRKEMTLEAFQNLPKGTILEAPLGYKLTFSHIDMEEGSINFTDCYKDIFDRSGNGYIQFSLLVYHCFFLPE